MSEFQRVRAQLPSMGPVTKWLCIAIVGVTLVATITQRSYGVGVSDLVFAVGPVLDLQLWRLVTFPFVELQFFGLVLDLLVLYFFGRFFEAQWGSRHYLRFFFVSSVGAAVLAIPLSFLVDLVAPFNEIGMAAGPGAAIDAMLVALAVTVPNSNVMFGFILPIRAKTLVLLVLGFQVIAGVMNGAAALSVTLGGMLMGYLLTTGMWRPERLGARLRSWLQRRRRRGLRVVDRPRRDETLH